jgi:DNA-binding response OmpR family regulator
MPIQINFSRSLAAVRRPRALAVDDHAATRTAHRQVLTLCGLTADVAVDGLDAIRAVAAAQATGQPYDLILLDIEMPFVNGWIAASTFRRNGYRGRLIVVSGNPDEDTSGRFASCGVDDFLLKPTTANVLMSTINACINLPQHLSPTGTRLPIARAYAN